MNPKRVFGSIRDWKYRGPFESAQRAQAIRCGAHHTASVPPATASQRAMEHGRFVTDRLERAPVVSGAPGGRSVSRVSEIT